MTETKNNTVRVVFVSLLLDLLAFTMILPLLPALLDHYKEIENGHGLYSTTLSYIKSIQVYFDAPDKVSTVLYGGFLGSMYSFLQFLGSPIIGALSDIYGRKPLMLLCLTGISLSYLLWTFSTNFGIFVLARFMGGISKGNISLSMAIISDVTCPKTRGKAMALVGIAFSIGFVVGPIIGAFFAWISSGNREGTWYVTPALFAFFLASSDLFFVTYYLKESLQLKYRATTLAKGLSGAISYINPIDLFQFNGVSSLSQQDQQDLKILGRAYFIYLFIYSGLEFTLTFLTHHTFGFTSMQQGWMFLGIGLIMAILQGGWVRHIPPNRTKAISELGLWLIIPAFICIGISTDVSVLSAGIFLFAVSTAMVVTCMMTLVTRIGPEHQKGVITGTFRSLGALARACGPIVASSAFWCIGSTSTYLIGAVFLTLPPLILHERNKKNKESGREELTCRRCLSINHIRAPSAHVLVDHVVNPLLDYPSTGAIYGSRFREFRPLRSFCHHPRRLSDAALFASVKDDWRTGRQALEDRRRAVRRKPQLYGYQEKQRGTRRQRQEVVITTLETAKADDVKRRRRRRRRRQTRNCACYLSAGECYEIEGREERITSL